MDERVGVTSNPLYWPTGWPRTTFPRHSAFNKTSVYHETQNVRAELERLGARKVIVSSNLKLRSDGIPYADQKMPSDAGVSVWFELQVEKVWREHVLACDRWNRPEHNLRAIFKHIEALRGQERWGVGTSAQAFAGFLAIPARASGTPWWEILGFDGDAENVNSLSKEDIERGFRRQALERHPDKGGTPEAWHELQIAREQGLASVRIEL